MSLIFDLQISSHVFLEQSDILYYKLRKLNTVCIGKNKNGSKMYKSKHYLLLAIKEVVSKH